eukprot:gene26-biopygen7725
MLGIAHLGRADSPRTGLMRESLAQVAAGSPKALGNVLSQKRLAPSTTSLLDLPASFIDDMMELLRIPEGVRFVHVSEHAGIASLRLTCSKLNSLVLARSVSMVFKSTSKQTDEAFLLPLRLFESMPRLDVLDLTFCQKLPLSLVGLPTALTCLNLSGIDESRSLPLLDISPLSSCIGLTDLNIDNRHSVVDLSPLAACKNLEILHLARCSARTSLTPLANCTNLEQIQLHATGITDLCPLSACTMLNTICFSCTKVSDLSPLSACSKLSDVDCSDTSVYDISPLAACSNLMEVDCRNTSVYDISPLSACSNLMDLDCEGTYVKNIASLAACTQLKRIACDRDVTGLYSDDDENEMDA